jgi:hypothetical protein
MVMLAKVLPVELGIPWYTQLLDKSDGNQDLILPKVFFSHGLYHMVTED